MPEKSQWSGTKDGLSGNSAECRLTDEEIEFAKAMDRYKTLRRRPFPTCHEVLAVVVSLGYRKVAPPKPIPRFEP